MARQEIPIIVLGADGRPYAGASVFIRTSPGGADATVYQARTGGATSANPLTSDAQGRVTGWLERGDYAATISSVAGLGPWVEEFPILSAADGAGDGLWLPDNVIITRHLADDVVTGAELADNAVTAAHIAADAVGSSELANAAVDQAAVAAGVVAFGPYTKMTTGQTNITASTSTLITHGLGTTALAVLYVLFGGGLIAGNRGVDSYDIPNATQFRIYWPGTPTIACRWFAFA